MKSKSKTAWLFQVLDFSGRLKSSSAWMPNLNTVEGAGLFLNTYYSGLHYSANWYVGLCFGAVNPTVNDTAAQITTGIPNPPMTNNWSEGLSYSGPDRQLLTWQAAELISPSLPSSIATKQSLMCVFLMTAPGVLGGGFMANSAAKGSTAGVLYCVDSGAGLLAFLAGDTIKVSVITGFVVAPG